MIILSLRTDNPNAEIGLYIKNKQIDYMKWQADRTLADSIHLRIRELLHKNKLKLNELGAVAIYKGPGSFTGLRIGFSVANALSYSLKIPIIAESGSKWLTKSLKRLLSGENDYIALPHYGAEPHITQPRK